MIVTCSGRITFLFPLSLSSHSFAFDFKLSLAFRLLSHYPLVHLSTCPLVPFSPCPNCHLSYCLLASCLCKVTSKCCPIAQIANCPVCLQMSFFYLYFSFLYLFSCCWCWQQQHNSSSVFFTGLSLILSLFY